MEKSRKPIRGFLIFRLASRLASSENGPSLCLSLFLGVLLDLSLTSACSVVLILSSICFNEDQTDASSKESECCKGDRTRQIDNERTRKKERREEKNNQCNNKE